MKHRQSCSKRTQKYKKCDCDIGHGFCKIHNSSKCECFK